MIARQNAAWDDAAQAGISGSFSPSGTTIMSQVLVPMIFTSVPGAMPDPTPPRCASNAPTATGKPAGNPVRLAHFRRQPRHRPVMLDAVGRNRDRSSPSFGSSCARNSASG